MPQGEQEVTSGSQEVGYPSEIEIIEDEETSEPDKPTKPESAYETAERILREAEAGNGQEKQDAERNEPDADADDTEQTEVGEIPSKVGRPKKGDDIEPPEYLSSDEKEEFKQMPRAGKRILTNALRRHQAKFTQYGQRVANAEREAKEYNQTAAMYLNQHPELIEKGYTGPRLLQELLGAHATLTGSDRERAKARYLQMGRELGFNVQLPEAESTNQTAQPVDIRTHPDFVALQATANEAKSYIDSVRNEQFQAQVNRIADEIQAVQNEKGPDGNYLYPETRDGAFLDQVKPLVSALAQTMPYGEALKRAYLAVKGPEAVQSNLSQGYQTKLPANQEIRQRAASAAVSVRGRSTPQSAANTLEIPKSALGSATDTARWIINHNRRGG